MHTKKPSATIGLLLSLTICFLVSFVGWLGTSRGLAFWYVTLQKPSFNPPSAIFAPVWTVLYTLMGVAAFQVWRADAPKRAKSIALTLHGVQLVLNGLWCWIFFAFHQLQWGFVELAVLLVTLVATVLAFYRVRPSAGWLLIPYLAWIGFATLLNFSIWRLNA